jgi:hypothetical protein
MGSEARGFVRCPERARGERMSTLTVYVCDFCKKRYDHYEKGMLSIQISSVLFAHNGFQEILDRQREALLFCGLSCCVGYFQTTVSQRVFSLLHKADLS